MLVIEGVAWVRFDAVRWFGFLAGVWLTIAPFLFDYGSPTLAFASFAAGLALGLFDAHATDLSVYSDPTTYNREIYHAQGGGKAYR